jgi:hypothetical protein
VEEADKYARVLHSLVRAEDGSRKYDNFRMRREGRKERLKGGK